MNLRFLSALTFLLGLAALALVLFLLQRLRVRHRRVPVVTTLFWHQAVDEARARVLVQRFRHPWAYVLALALAGLLWLGVAGPRGTQRGEGDHVLVLDASLRSAQFDRMEHLRSALDARVASLPRDARRVVALADGTHTLLLPGEDPELLGPRLEALNAQAAPADLDAALDGLVAGRDTSRPLTLWLFGDAAPRAGFAETLPLDVQLERGVDPEAPTDAAGIARVGLGEAHSGRFEFVDVAAVVRGTADAPLWTLDGAPLEGLEVLRSETLDGVRFVLRDVPARGGRLEVRLPRVAGASEDDHAALRLPDRRPIAVHLTAGTPEVLRAVLDGDPAVRLVTAPGEADVIVGGAPGGERPTLSLSTTEEQEEAILLTHLEERDSSEVLARALGELALDRIDAMDLATAAARPIAVGARPGSARGISLWRELLEAEPYNFVQTRAFPLFVGRSVRWLAEVEAPVTHAVAGMPLAAGVHARPGAWIAPDGTELDPLGGAFVPALAGEFVRPAGSPLEVSLAPLVHAPGAAQFSADSSLDSGLESPLETGRAPRASGGLRTLTWIGLLALALLLFEWRQVRTGRMP